MKMIFLGPPAVGKGTHARGIAERMNLGVISTGESLREEVEKGTKLGKMAKKYMDKGSLVPDKIVIEILKEKLKNIENKKGFIFDGFPRTLEQAKLLDKLIKIDIVVNFQVSHETLMKRMCNRITCRKCAKIYNTLFIPPKKEGICDDCGGELYQREDQKPEIVENRLKVYEKETKPLIDFYKKKGILIGVSAEGSVEEVNNRLHKTVSEYFEKK